MEFNSTENSENPYMNSFPGHWYRHFSSASEAKEFIGFEKFSYGGCSAENKLGKI